ncbi:MAG: Stress response protein nst1 [Cirrosporium novae-zelandiae]|nr:MAG: Stress response protein nst1 [Cirrosporium novae-zelandiae]
MAPSNNATSRGGSGGISATVSKVQDPNSNSSAQSPKQNISATPVNGTLGSAPVNRKKQKRRQKRAARLAEQQQNGEVPTKQIIAAKKVAPYTAVNDAPIELDYDDVGSEDLDQYEHGEGEDYYYTEDDAQLYHNIPRRSPPNGYPPSNFDSQGELKKSKKKRNKNRSVSHTDFEPTPLGAGSNAHSHSPPLPPPPTLTSTHSHSEKKLSKDRIWNTSTQEERQRIKEFWLSLGEEERRSLVKVEKEAVLRKMKEQQKHSCSCTVCGRKRTAIEEELEVLYDAYYDELEQYANHQQGGLVNGVPPPRLYGHSNRSVPSRVPPLVKRQPSIQESSEFADDDGDEYSEDEDDEDYSDAEPEEDVPRGPAADFFNFGNSLTVQGGILTVADDLLKNDGKKFIEMMEQLAERRMAREEEAQYGSGISHSSAHSGQGHNHAPPLDEEDYDDEEEYDDEDDEEEYDSQEDEMDAMTEEQRMEEGRRMFQIFAARMFEQRVLTAYREKVARERQQKLIEELEEESKLDLQREAKKQKEAQKKKAKKQAQKQQREEERAKREAEKAAEEAAARALEEKRLEEQKRRKEEQRKKKEAEKKAQDEERLRKEAEKQKRLIEERERQAEVERKQREQKERERKKREEARRKEKEERDAKEKAAKEKRQREEQERREKEAAARAEKEVQERANQAKREEQASSQTSAQASKRPQPIPIPPGLHPPQSGSHLQSPHLPIATPIIPKAPTPVRLRQSSQHGSHSSSPQSSHVAPRSSQSTSPNHAPFSTPGKPIDIPVSRSGAQNPALYHPQPSAPLSPLTAPPGTSPQPSFNFPGLQNAFVNSFPSSNPSMLPGVSQRTSLSHNIPMNPHPQFSPGVPYRSFGIVNGIGVPPGINGSRILSQGRGYPPDASFHPPPLSMQGTGPQLAMAKSAGPMSAHSRHQSASFEKPNFGIPTSSTPTQPIARPAPIQRPSSTAPHERSNDTKPSNADIDDLSKHLGSSALLDDNDAPIEAGGRNSMPPISTPGTLRSGRLGFGASPLFPDAMGIPGGPGWGAPQLGFGAPGMPNGVNWGNSAGWVNGNAFAIGGQNRPAASRPVMIRLLVCQACKQLTQGSPTDVAGPGFHNAATILRQVEQLKPPNEAPIAMKEMLEICDTEGDSHNGGGSFLVKDDGPRGFFVKFEPDANVMVPGARPPVAPGEIGSPVPNNILPLYGATRHFPNGIAPPTGF